MTLKASLHVHQAGPGVSVQDSGRVGWLAQGLSTGGAADRLALAEGAALLGQPVAAALEMAGFGGRFSVTAQTRIALTGAPMRASVDGVPLRWQASHLLSAGAILDIGGCLEGAYGYLTVGGGFALPDILGAPSAHLSAGLGRTLAQGDRLPLMPDPGGPVGYGLNVAPRWSGGTLRILPSLQTPLFDQTELERFCTTGFTRDARANRMGLRLLPDGSGFALTGGQSILSEVVVPGDVQVPGDGAPYVLLYECQTTGGYPRIGTVIPCDLPLAAQTPAGAALRFRFVTRADALDAEKRHHVHVSGLTRSAYPLVRNPADIPDLLSYSLISGVITGEETD